MKKKLVFLMGLLCASLLSVFGANVSRPFNPNGIHEKDLLPSISKFNPSDIVLTDGAYIDGNTIKLAPKKDAEGPSFTINADKYKDLVSAEDFKFSWYRLSVVAGNSSDDDDALSFAINWAGVREVHDSVNLINTTKQSPLVHDIKIENLSETDTLFIGILNLLYDSGNCIKNVNIPVIKANDPKMGSVNESSITGTLYIGETLGLVATPNPGYKFVRWSSPYATYPITSFGLEELDSIVAIFEPLAPGETVPDDQFYVTVVPRVYGVYEDFYDQCADIKGTGFYRKGDSLRLEVVTKPNVGFDGFTSKNGYSTTIATGEDIIYADFYVDMQHPTDEPVFVLIFNIEPNNPDWGTVDATEFEDLLDYGSTLGVTATPNPGYKFVGWSDPAVSNPITDDLFIENLVAIFAPIGEDTGDDDDDDDDDSTVVTPPVVADSFNVTVVGRFRGFEDEYNNCGYVFGSGFYHMGDSLKLAVETNVGYKFLGFTSKNGFSTTVAEGADTIYADFDLNIVHVVINVIKPNNPEWGSVNDTHFDLNLGVGSTLGLTATPNPGYEFVGWDHYVVTQPLTDSLFIDTLIAYFEPKDTGTVDKHFYVTVVGRQLGFEDNYNICGYVSGSGYYSKGDSLRLSVHVNAGYKFLGFTSKNGFSTTVAEGADTIYAEFGPNHCSVAIKHIVSNKSSWGSVNVAYVAMTYSAGDTLELKAMPNKGYKFVGWSHPEVAEPLPYGSLQIDTLIAYFEPVDSDHSFVPNASVEIADPLVNVYTIDGRAVRLNVPSSEALAGLKKGTYIVGGKKVRVVN